MNWSLAELAHACGAAMPAALDPRLPVTGLSTDSRSLSAGEAFLALVGERFDGHDYVAQALQQGAVAAVVSRPVPELPERQLLVPDTLVALGRIAHLWRERMPARVVAITGSVGKSTTKGLLAAICEQAGPTIAAEGTENNEIGVPRTLLRLTEHTRYAVLEFGMRGRGEIRHLTEIARPNVGVITAIGEAHIGRLGSREAIAESKAEMLPLLPPDGVAVLPADDFFFALLSGLCPCPVLSFGFGEGAHVRCLEVRDEALTALTASVLLGDETVDLTVSLPGRHNLANALAAAAAGLAMGCTVAQIRQGIEGYSGMEMRGEFLAGPAGSTVLNDAYNANPTSVEAALGVLGQAPGRKLFVFGDMLELGDDAPEAHRRVGEQAARAGVTVLVTVGEMAALAAWTARDAGLEAIVADTPEAAAEALAPLLREGDTVLVKGSRGIALERTVRRLTDGS